MLPWMNLLYVYVGTETKTTHLRGVVSRWGRSVERLLVAQRVMDHVGSFICRTTTPLAGMRRLTGSVATFGVSHGASARGAQLPSQAASWNSAAMNSACALMSLPPIFRTCPFLIIAIAS